MQFQKGVLQDYAVLMLVCCCLPNVLKPAEEVWAVVTPGEHSRLIDHILTLTPPGELYGVYVP